MCPFVAKDLSYVSNVFFRPGLRGGVRTGPARERGTQPPGRRLECLHLLRKSNKYVGRLPSHKDHVRFEGRDRGEDTAGLLTCMSVGSCGQYVRWSDRGEETAGLLECPLAPTDDMSVGSDGLGPTFEGCFVRV